jgi:hypothetical protein
MAKSFFQLLNEAPPPPPPPGGPLGGGGLGGGPLGGPSGGLPPPPPMGGMGGGMGGLGGPPGMGGEGGGQPIPVKVIDAWDVWKVLKEALKDMDKFKELNINYNRKKKDVKEEKPVDKKSALIS